MPYTRERTQVLLIARRETKTMAQSKPILAAKYRYPGKGWRPVTVMFPVIALALGILQTFNLNPFGFLLLQSGYLYLLIATLLPLCFLWIPLNHKVIREGVPWYDVVFVILGVCIPVSFFFLEKEIMFKGWSMGSPAFPFIAALLMWIVTIEAGRRVAAIKKRMPGGARRSWSARVVGRAPSLHWDKAANVFSMLATCVRPRGSAQQARICSSRSGSGKSSVRAIAVACSIRAPGLGVTRENRSSAKRAHRARAKQR